MFHEITGVTDALKKNAHDQNEQTIVRDILSLTEIKEITGEKHI